MGKKKNYKILHAFVLVQPLCGIFFLFFGLYNYYERSSSKGGTFETMKQFSGSFWYRSHQK